MSNYSHRGYEQRTSGCGRRRHKGSGFKKKKSGGSAAKAAVTIAVIAVVCSLVFIFVRYIGDFVDSFRGTQQSETADVPTLTDTPDLPNGYYDTVDGKVFVSQGSAYLMFKGIDHTAQNYAAVLNSIASSVSGDITLYNMVIPTNTEFGLAESLRADSNSQRDNLDRINSSLMYNVHSIDLYGTLQLHKNEYIYYRTDQSLTSLGAYYAYLEYLQIIKSAETDDVPLYSLSQLSEKKGTIARFEGELLRRTVDEETQPHGNQELFENADIIDYYKLPVHYNCYVVDTSSGEFKEKDLFTEDNAKEDPLSVFPARNTELMVVYNIEAKTDEKLLIVKDSAAEPIIGYIIPCYAEVHIADAQLFDGNLGEYIKNNNITQVLVANGIDDANNTLYCQRLRDLFDSSITGK